MTGSCEIVGNVPMEGVLLRVGAGQVTFNTEGPEGSGDPGA